MPGAESLRAEVEEDEEEGLGSNRLFITIINSNFIVEACMAEWLTPRTSDMEIFTRVRVSLALLSLRKNGGLLIV